jgi:hypothetical protein
VNHHTHNESHSQEEASEDESEQEENEKIIQEELQRHPDLMAEHQVPTPQLNGHVEHTKQENSKMIDDTTQPTAPTPVPAVSASPLPPATTPTPAPAQSAPKEPLQAQQSVSNNNAPTVAPNINLNDNSLISNSNAIELPRIEITPPSPKRKEIGPAVEVIVSTQEPEPPRQPPPPPQEEPQKPEEQKPQPFVQPEVPPPAPQPVIIVPQNQPQQEPVAVVPPTTVPEKVIDQQLDASVVVATPAVGETVPSAPATIVPVVPAEIPGTTATSTPLTDSGSGEIMDEKERVRQRALERIKNIKERMQKQQTA